MIPPKRAHLATRAAALFALLALLAALSPVGRTGASARPQQTPAAGSERDRGKVSPDLKEKARVAVSVDFTGGRSVTSDIYGHGTHVAGLAAGDDTVYGNTYNGVAPNAKIINLKVLNDAGQGTTSQLLKALDWVMTNRAAYNIRVVNLSLGAAAIDSYKNDPLCKAVRGLVNAGVVVVAAAGNDGKNGAGQKVYGRIHSPGNEPSAITVGASNTYGTDFRNDDGVASFSSRGPTRSYWTDSAGTKHYDNIVKPDLVAPGNKLISASGNDNYFSETYPHLVIEKTSDDGRKMQYMSGTSMAAPIVAGAGGRRQAGPGNSRPTC